MFTDQLRRKNLMVGTTLSFPIHQSQFQCNYRREFFTLKKTPALSPICIFDVISTRLRYSAVCFQLTYSPIYKIIIVLQSILDY